MQVEIQKLSFRFSETTDWIVRDLDLQVPNGARVLLVGANGTGKSTLLRLLAGLHLPTQGQVLMNGADSFRSLSVAQSVAWVSEEFPFVLDLHVHELVELREEDKFWLECLGIDTQWRMNKVSQGQRKRVQLFLALRERYWKMLLLDEVTAHLDVTVRNNFLTALKERQQTIVYCTHIFDGIEAFNPTHVLWLGTNAWGFGEAEYVTKLFASSSWNMRIDRFIRENRFLPEKLPE